MAGSDFLTEYEVLLRDAARRLSETPRMRRPRRLAAAPALVTSAIAAVAVLAVGATTLNRDHAATGGRELTASRGSAAPGFGILTRSRTSHDTVPPALVTQLSEDAGGAAAAVDWSASRLATRQLGFDVFVAPADSGICLIARSARTGADLVCGAPSAARAGDLLIRVADRGDTVVIGLMPDGVSSVTMRATGSSSPVEGNTFVAPAGRRVGQIRWTDVHGPHAAELPASPLGPGGTPTP